MFFLKIGANGFKKKNIIFIENFIDPITKIEIKSNGFKSEIFNVHDTKNKLSNDIKISQKIYLKLIKKIKFQIEKFYKIKINYKIIHLIFSKWLYYYISNCYYKYKILLNIKKKYPKFSLIEIENQNITEEDKLLYSPDSTILNFRLLKDVGKFLNIDTVKIELARIKKIAVFIPTPKDKKNMFSISYYIKSLFSILSIKISKFMHNSSVQIHDDALSFFNILKIIFKSRFKYSYLFFVENNSIKAKISDPKIFIAKIKSDNFIEKMLLQNLLDYIPNGILVLIEYYKNNIQNKKIKKNRDIIVSKRFFAAGYLNFKKFIIKNFVNNVLISYQHGGLYGQEKNYFPEKAEILVTDYFATWGWKSKKTLPLPLDLVEVDNKKNQVKNDCLFVTISSSYSYLSYQKNPEMIPDNSMKQTFDLLLKISKKIPVTLRLPPYKHVWRDREYFKKIKELKIDNHKKNFKYMASKSKFVIHNHFNSTALETLSLNIPTLIFSDKKLLEFNHQAEKDLKKLIKAKIFFYNHLDLLNFLKKNNFDLELWWNQKKVQDARKSFCETYACRRANWVKDWLLKLKTIKTSI